MRGFAATLMALAALAVIGLLTIYIPVRGKTGKITTPELGPGEVLAPPNTENVTPPSLAITASIDEGPWTKDTAIYPMKGQKATLRVKQVPGGVIRWYRIVPDISKIYKNANHPWEANPYKWVGLAKIDYSRRELTKFHGQWLIQPFSEEAPVADTNKVSASFPFLTRASADSQHYHKDVGSFWFQAEVEKHGKVERSPGIEDCDKRGLSPQVFRVSIREGDGYLGYLTTFFNVPGVFGSIPYQSNNYLGADCCDALLAAYGVWSGKRITKDYSVAMLVSQLPKATECDVVGGKPDREIKWGKDIHPGNFIAVKFPGAKAYQHIGALYSDTDKDGVLSAGDLVLHAGPLPLHHSRLGEGCFDGHVVILDQKLSRLAASNL